MMILIAGGTGFLGPKIVHLLTARGLQVRIMTRNPDHAQHLRSDLVEIVKGDVRDFDDVKRAVDGVGTVISAISGFGMRGVNPRTVDWKGNSNLIRAALAEEVEHFVLVSIHGAAKAHPVELYRMKYLAEQELRTSGLAWTIIRPTISMDTFLELMGETLLKTGRTRIFGSGENPINFVSGQDIAQFVELAVTDPAMRGATVEVGGPENLTMMQFLQTLQTMTGKVGATNHVPLGMMRFLSVLMRPVNPALARQIQAAVIMDTTDMSFDATDLRKRYPSIPITTLAEEVKRKYVLDARA
jgi:uncharacterized protein YbjT (DUF2867 family)